MDFVLHSFAALLHKLTGSIPTQVGSLKKLNVLALQYNLLTGAIPASLGDLEFLTRLDLSFNGLFGPVLVKLANAPSFDSFKYQIMMGILVFSFQFFIFDPYFLF